VAICLRRLIQIARTRLSLPFNPYFRRTSLPKSRFVRERSQNGEIHFILPESELDEKWKDAEDFNDSEIRKFMKKEASKPLLLMRAE